MAIGYEGRALQRCNALLDQGGGLGIHITAAILEHKRVLSEFQRAR